MEITLELEKLLKLEWCSTPVPNVGQRIKYNGIKVCVIKIEEREEKLPIIICHEVET